MAVNVLIRYGGIFVLCRTRNVTVAQLKKFPLELLLRMSTKIYKLHPTIPAHSLVEIYRAG